MGSNRLTEKDINEFIELGRSMQDISYEEWLRRYFKIKELDWREFSFEGHEPMREIYSNYKHPHITLRKAAQLGASTFSIARSLYSGDKFGLSTAYYFSTDTDVDDFVDDKFAHIIEQSEYLSNLSKNTSTDNKGLKVFRGFVIYFRGVHTKRKVKSITVDHVVKDEVDEANQENLKFADDRMLHSKYKWITELSQPSIDDFGIDASFKRSDMRFFGIKCGCGLWNFPDETWPDCLMTRGDTVYIGCIKCTKKLNITNGEWVPKVGSRTKDQIGYHLSHLIFNVTSPAEIKKRYDEILTTAERKNFQISILGKPYSNSNSKPITLSVLQAAERDYTLLPQMNTQSSYFGMDVGDKCHLVFGHAVNKIIRVHWFAELAADDEEGIVSLVRRHRPICGVIDAMPYKTLSKNIAREFPGDVYIQYFKGDTLNSSMEGEGDKAVPKVTTNRTESLDNTTDLLREGRIELPRYKRTSDSMLPLYNLFRDHCQMLIKEPIERSNGITEYEYKHNVPNHLGMALNSMVIAYELSKPRIFYDDRFIDGNFY
ncbi:terminase [Leptospira santarosai]|nr:terminase [Leptospira santarosai]